jgi:uncharacterized protein YecE (DUF72 family)
MKIEITNPRSEVAIGCQGWNYADWTTRDGSSPVFYPRGTRSAGMLALYSRVFGTTEIDSTFYAMPPESNIDGWRDKTPAGFTFSPKMPRQITHELRLGRDSLPLAEEFCDRIRRLGDKLAACLIQLPPQFDATRANAVTMRTFLDALPRDIRFAVEFRRPEWLVDWTFGELAKHGVVPAIVEGRWIGNTKMFETAARARGNFAYFRFMGERDLDSFDRVRRDRSEHLADWAARIASIDTDRTYVYFSNLYEGHAPVSCRKLAGFLGLETVDPATLEEQRALF